MTLFEHKTKIVCTIGPASQYVEILKEMMLAGMNVARLNFSHGDFESHQKVIQNIRAASEATGLRVAILGDLPGPKMRIGHFKEEPINLASGDGFTLTSQEIQGNKHKVSVSFTPLPRVVKPGDTLFLNDGFIELMVENVQDNDVICRVKVGGELRSRKGLNLPGIDLGVGAFTENDRKWLKFAIEHGVDAISQSFVQSAEDIKNVRLAAESMGGDPFIIAKIERLDALENMDAILNSADGIMVARGDLGVEIPIEKIAIIQKKLMRKANIQGKPVITATQMLESMIHNRRPTRAESTDVANAILDGTDCIMLSEESAMGNYVVDATRMLAKIAAVTEIHRPYYRVQNLREDLKKVQDVNIRELTALNIENMLSLIPFDFVLAPTRSGATARSITRFRLPVWIAAVSSHQKTCQHLQFSYGVFPVHEKEHPEDWNAFAETWRRTHGFSGDLAILTKGPSSKNPEANNSIEIINLKRKL